MKKVGNFSKDPAELVRQVDQLEENVDGAVRALDAKLDPYVVVPTKAVTYSASPGDAVPIDTSAASAVVILPQATTQNAGQRIAVLRLSASNTLTALSSSGQVQGGTIDTLAASIGLIEYVSFGAKGWWRRA